MLRRNKLFISVSRMIKGAGETSRRRRYFFSASPILLTDRYRRWWMRLQQRPLVHTIHFQFDSSRRRSRNAKKVSGSPLGRLQVEKKIAFPNPGVSKLVSEQDSQLIATYNSGNVPAHIFCFQNKKQKTKQKQNVKLPLGLVKLKVTKMYGGVGVWLHRFLIWH